MLFGSEKFDGYTGEIAIGVIAGNLVKQSDLLNGGGNDDEDEE